MVGVMVRHRYGVLGDEGVVGAVHGIDVCIDVHSVYITGLLSS